MVMPLKQAKLLGASVEYGSMYCGYDQEVRDAARALEDAGLGEIVGGTFGPELAPTEAGRAAIAQATGEATA